MAITDFNSKDRPVQLGNRNDACYMCESAIALKKFKNEMEYRKARTELKGILEGQSVLRIKRSGAETVICMPCLHAIVKENPLTEV